MKTQSFNFKLKIIVCDEENIDESAMTVFYKHNPSRKSIDHRQISWVFQFQSPFGSRPSRILNFVFYAKKVPGIVEK